MKKYKINKNELPMPAFGGTNALILSSFFLMAGISAGISLDLLMAAYKKSAAAGVLTRYLSDSANLHSANPFFASLTNHILLLLVIFAAGLSVYLFPLALFALFYKGFTLGFSVCLIMETMSLKGVSFILLSVVPQNILLLPAFLFAALVCVDYALATLAAKGTKPRRGMKKAKAMPLNVYLISFLISSGMILLGCIIEGLLFAIVC